MESRLGRASTVTILWYFRTTSNFGRHLQICEKARESGVVAPVATVQTKIDNFLTSTITTAVVEEIDDSLVDFIMSANLPFRLVGMILFCSFQLLMR